jgi:hypothetical protein
VRPAAMMEFFTNLMRYRFGGRADGVAPGRAADPHSTS